MAVATELKEVSRNAPGPPAEMRGKIGARQVHPNENALKLNQLQGRETMS